MTSVAFCGLHVRGALRSVILKVSLLEPAAIGAIVHTRDHIHDRLHRVLGLRAERQIGEDLLVVGSRLRLEFVWLAVVRQLIGSSYDDLLSADAVVADGIELEIPKCI